MTAKANRFLLIVKTVLIVEQWGAFLCSSCERKKEIRKFVVYFWQISFDIYILWRRCYLSLVDRSRSGSKDSINIGEGLCVLGGRWENWKGCTRRLCFGVLPRENLRKNESRCGHVGKCFMLNELWPKQKFSYGQIHRNSAIRWKQQQQHTGEFICPTWSTKSKMYFLFHFVKYIPCAV